MPSLMQKSICLMHVFFLKRAVSSLWLTINVVHQMVCDKEPSGELPFETIWKRASTSKIK